MNSLQDHSVLGTWQAAATSKNPFTILKRFLQIRPYSYGKFSLLSDSLEIDLNTFTLNYYLAFKGFCNKQGNESNPDKKQPKRYLTALNYTQVFVQVLT